MRPPYSRLALVLLLVFGVFCLATRAKLSQYGPDTRLSVRVTKAMKLQQFRYPPQVEADLTRTDEIPLPLLPLRQVEAEEQADPPPSPPPLHPHLFRPPPSV